MKKIVITMALTVLSLATFAKDNFKMTLLNAYLGETDVFLSIFRCHSQAKRCFYGMVFFCCRKQGKVADMLIIA